HRHRQAEPSPHQGATAVAGGRLHPQGRVAPGEHVGGVDGLSVGHDGHRDGKLIVVRRDGQRYRAADGIAPTLQAALDDWAACEPKLRALAEDLESGRGDAAPLDPEALHAPLPRAYEWVDGSAYINHIVLVRKARGAEPPATLETDPLVYQGGSGVLLGPRENIPLVDVAWG